jgi:Na+/H+-dicarboxylate symporter
MFKKLKLPLHWQILIAIVLAVFYGLTFPNKYKFNVDNFEKFVKVARQNAIPAQVISNLEKTIYSNPLSKTEIIETATKGSDFVLLPVQEKTILKYSVYNKEISYVHWMGIIFMRALKMIIVPLVLTSIISGIASIGSAGNLGRLGLKTIIYYLSTSTLAILAGLFFVNLIKPGIGSQLTIPTNIDDLNLTKTSFSDTIINIVPDNIFKAFIEQEMLSIIFFSLLFGFFITKLNYKSKAFLTDFFSTSNEVIMKMTMFIILFTPFGIFGLISKTIADQADSLSILAKSLGLYSLTVMAGLIFHSFVLLPLIVKIFGKSKPYKLLSAMKSALLTAFSTASSGATLSLTMESVQHKAGVSNKVAGFTLPLGATINMDGTALYECVAAIFVAQVYGYDLTVTEQLIIVVTALLASIGAAAIPMAGLVMLSVVLSSVDLPLAGIALILPVDRFLDMFRTSVNVWSDSCGAVVVAKSEGEELLL